MARKFFFQSTDDAVARMTELFDFVWPAVTALAHARSKSYRYRNLTSNQQQATLAKAFLGNRALRKEYRNISGLKRASLKKAFIDTNWHTQEQVFARLVLVNIFAIHEGWLDDLMTELQPTRHPNVTWKEKTFIDATQFPYANKKHKDWAWAINELNLLKSPNMEACFGSELRQRRWYSPLPDAQNYVVCYRYFKELRNAVVHRGGKASTQLIASQTAFGTIAANISQFNKAATPGTLCRLSAGDRVELSLYGVVGFNDVVLRLMATLDADAAVTELAEAALANFFKNRTNMKSSSGQRDGTLRRMADDYGFVGLAHPSEFASILTRHGVAIP